MPHVANVEVALMRAMPDLSVGVADAPVRPLYEVITFQVKPGKDAQFIHVLTKLKTALTNLGDGVEYTVFRSAQGGRGGEWLISIPHDGFASMGGGGNEAAFEAMMVDALGAFEARSVLDMLGDALVSESREVFSLRTDLSLNLGN